MEWTRENVLGTYIRCRTKTEKDKVIKFYESLGYEKSAIPTMEGTSVVLSLRGVMIGTYLEVLDGYKLINPLYKPRRKFPREMMVSVTGKNNDWIKKIVFGKIKDDSYPFITKELSQPAFRFDGWKYAKEID